MTDDEFLEKEFAEIVRERRARRHWRRVWRVTVGTILIVAGIAMCVLPGPGILTIIAGLALMADEVPLARRILDKMKEKARRVEDKVRDRFND